MPMTPNWYDDTKTILVFKFTEPAITTWDEYDLAIDEGWAMIRAVKHDVFPVFAAGTTPMPTGNPMPHLRRSLRILPKNVPTTLNIVDNRFVEAILQMLRSIHMSDKMVLIHTWAEAEAYIKDYFATNA